MPTIEQINRKLQKIATLVDEVNQDVQLLTKPKVKVNKKHERVDYYSNKIS